MFLMWLINAMINDFKVRTRCLDWKYKKINYWESIQGEKPK